MTNVNDIMSTIKIRESGGDYTAKNSGSSASGAYQYINSTWQAEATKAGIDWQGNGWTSAYMAPASVQDTVAKNNIQNILNSNNGNINAVPNVWYTGNPQGNMTASQIAANNGLTSQQYTSKWLADYAKVTGGTLVTDTNGEKAVVDENGTITARASNAPAPTSGFEVYTGAEQLQLIQSMQDLENFEGNWEENSLDEYGDFIYNLELFLVDRADTIKFMKTPPQTIENDGWPAVGQKKVVIAKTGETAEFVITDLVVDSMSVGGIGAQSSIIANAATELSFNITRVGNARLGDAIQDAVALAGYQDVASANFFIKIKFTRIGINGAASTVPNSTKVLPFRLKKVVDISTSTDNRGTSASLEGVILRNYAVTTSSVGQLKYKITSNIEKNSADTTITNFLEKLNQTIREKSYGVSGNFNIEYKYVRDEAFLAEYPTLIIGDPTGYRTGPGGSEVENIANPSYGTIAIANNTLEVQPTTNIIDVIKDILINTNQIRASLTTPNKTFTDLFSIEVDYEPKDNGYNVLTKSEGAIVTYRVCKKEELIEHNTRNQIDQLSNINQILSTIISSGRLKKKYYYYYTGKNDQIMQFDIVLNNQLLKVQNEEFDVYYDENQVNQLDNYLENLRFYSDTRLKSLMEEFDNSKQSVSRTEAALNDAKAAYASQVQSIKNDFLDRINAELGGSDFILSQTIIDNHFSGIDIYDINSFEEEFAKIEQELGLTDGTVYTEDVRQSLRDLRDQVTKASEEFANAKAKLSEMETDAVDTINSTLGARISTRLYAQGFGNTDDTFAMVGVTSNIATIEDLGTDLRRKLTTVEIAGLLNFLSTSSATFVSGALGAIKDPTTGVKLILPNDQKKLQIARAKYLEGWSQDLSMINATMKIKGDPYWLQNYITAEERSNAYGTNNYRPNNVSTAVGTNFIMVVTNTVEGVDGTGQPIVSNLFRYLYMVKSIKSEFSSGLFTQTLDMVRFTMAETYNTNPLSSESSSNSDTAGQGEGLGEESVREGVQPGESITVDDTQNPIGDDGTGNPNINGQPLGDMQGVIDQLNDAQRKSEKLFFDSNGNPRTMTQQEMAQYEELQVKIEGIFERYPNINQIIARLQTSARN